MRAGIEGRSSPAAPEPDVATNVANAAEYVGVFSGPQGQLEFVSEGERLFLLREGKGMALERLTEDDQFHVPDMRFARFPLVFGRKPAKEDEETDKASLPVVEVSWGDAWYAASAYEGPREFEVPNHWRGFVGHYRNENPWIGSVRVVILKGKLMLSVTYGVIPLEADGELFRLRDDPANTDWIRFGEIVNGKCMHLKYSGEDLWRVASA